MKDIIVILIALQTLWFTSCVKKNQTSQNTSQSISITTGTNTIINPATQNSTLQIGGSVPGWAFGGCTASNNTLTAWNGNTSVELVIGGGTPVNSIYSLISGIPLTGQARIIITNAPGQPSGVKWYSKTGLVTITTGTTGVIATFSNVPCAQTSFTFPIVTTTGTLTCF